MSDRHERVGRIARAFDGAMREAWPQGLPTGLAAIRRAKEEAMAVATTRKERKLVERRAAEVVLTLACATPTTWKQVNDAWKAVVRLGFANVDRRVQNGLLLARWCINHRSHFSSAQKALNDSLMRLRRLPRGHALRAALEPRVEGFLQQLHGPNVEHDS